jgi:hypothetical protein
VRYVSLAYGTRAEIIELIQESASSPGRSQRRRAEAEVALEDLAGGDGSVTFGGTTYIVDEDGSASGTQSE